MINFRLLTLGIEWSLFVVWSEKNLSPQTGPVSIKSFVKKLPSPYYMRKAENKEVGVKLDTECTRLITKNKSGKEKRKL